ncbi:MAG: DUF87 domain-containing protein [Candidatus Micrarchaeaceae archaeon]
MYVNIGEGIDIDAQLIMTGRGCALGQSGSGKSYLIGVIAEELCKLHLPFMIIDTEGEYANLKEKFSVINVNAGSAFENSDVSYANSISEAIAKNMAIIFDISEAYDKAEEVKKFAANLYSFEEQAKTPFLIILEEADKFVPQTIKKEVNIIEEISVRGRKKGIGLLIATQRPANVSKVVLSQCSYGFVGKLTVHNDIYAVKTLLEDQSQLAKLPDLHTGEFVPFGIGIKGIVKIKSREIKALGSTPLIGQKPLKAQYNEITYRIIKPLHEINEAKAKATKNLLGMRLYKWSIESYKNVYIEMELFKVFDLIGKREFQERYMLAGNGYFAVLAKKRLFIYAVHTAKLSENEKKVMEALASKKKANFYDLVNMTGMKEIDCEEALDILHNAGYIKERKGKFAMLYKDMLMKEKPSLVEKDAKEIAEIKDKGKNLIESALYGCKIESLGKVYLCMYSITLRRKEKLKKKFFDSIELKDRGELEKFFNFAS